MSVVDTSSVMLNDSLAARLFHGHNYKESLFRDTVAPDNINDEEFVTFSESDSFFSGLVDFFSSLPWVVYAIFGVLLLALMAYWAYRSGMMSFHFNRHTVENDAENVYEIDYDSELDEALRKGDHIRLVRLIYLSTLRSLDESGRIAWRIYKTPSEYAAELADTDFLRMTNLFLRVRYGDFAADRSDYEAMCVWQARVLKGGEA